MSIWEWYVRRGRIDRRTWWVQYFVPVAVLSVLALFADLALGNTDLQRMVETGVLDYGPIVQVVALLTLPASISGAVTRLHDRGLPAWLMLIVFVPLFGQLALLGLTGFVRGDAGANKYGPPPSGAPHAGPGEPLYVPPTWN